MPSLTEGDIEALIDTEDYYQFPDTTVTVCCLTLVNGFHVIGQSACVHPLDFDEKLGREIAYDDAKSKIWELEGYRIKSTQSQDQ